MSTPELHLRTLFLLDNDDRILGTREPEPSAGALFCLIRGSTACAWAVRADVPPDIAAELDRLARKEPQVSDFRDAPVHAKRYMALVEGRCDSGPAFAFPDELARPHGTVLVDDVETLGRHFSGLTASEFPYRTPIVAVVEKGRAVSVCFSSRLSDIAAECGVETAAGTAAAASPRELRLRGRGRSGPPAAYRCIARRGPTPPHWQSPTGWT